MNEWGIRHADGTVERCPNRKAAEFAALFPVVGGKRPEVVKRREGVWVGAGVTPLIRPAIDRALDGDHRICGTDPCSDCR